MKAQTAFHLWWSNMKSNLLMIVMIVLALSTGCGQPDSDSQSDVLSDLAKEHDSSAVEVFEYKLVDFSIDGVDVDVEENSARASLVQLPADKFAKFRLTISIPRGQAPIAAAVIGFALESGGRTLQHNSASAQIEPVVGSQQGFTLLADLKTPGKPGEYWVWVDVPSGSNGGRKKIIDRIPVSVK